MPCIAMVRMGRKGCHWSLSISLMILSETFTLPSSLSNLLFKSNLLICKSILRSRLGQEERVRINEAKRTGNERTISLFLAVMNLLAMTELRRPFRPFLFLRSMWVCLSTRYLFVKRGGCERCFHQNANFQWYKTGEKQITCLEIN